MDLFSAAASKLLRALEEKTFLPLGIRRQRRTREILDVVGDDYFRTCSRRGGQGVAVFLMVCYRGNQVSKAIDSRFRKMSPDFVLAVHGLLGREAEVL